MPTRYLKLTEEIAAADTHATLERLRERVRLMDLHWLERQAIERLLRSRADTLRLHDREASLAHPGPDRLGSPDGSTVTDNRELLDQIYDAGGRLTLEAPGDDAAYPAFNDVVETLLTVTRYGYLECEATPDRTRRGRTYLTVVATLTTAGRELVERRRARSEDWP